MTQYRFYHLTSTPLVKALGELAIKAVAQGHRILVVAGNEDQVKTLDDGLWTWKQDAFLAHGWGKDPHPELTPVWLTADSDLGNAPNGADMLILTGGTAAKGNHSLVCDMFDGSDEGQLTAARARWKTLKEQGLSPTYFQQTASGGWEQK